MHTAVVTCFAPGTNQHPYCVLSDSVELFCRISLLADCEDSSRHDEGRVVADSAALHGFTGV